MHREQLLPQQLAVHTAELTELLVVVEHLAPVQLDVEQLAAVQLAVVQLAVVQLVPERQQQRLHAVHSAWRVCYASVAL